MIHIRRNAGDFGRWNWEFGGLLKLVQGGGVVDRPTPFEVLPALVCVAKNLS